MSRMTVLLTPILAVDHQERVTQKALRLACVRLVDMLKERYLPGGEMLIADLSLPITDAIYFGKIVTLLAFCDRISCSS
jgi:hypothetical protein